MTARCAENTTDSGQSPAPARAAVPTHAAVVATSVSAPAQQFRERRVVRDDLLQIRLDPQLRARIARLRTAAWA